jgi:hypothetical protein
MTVLQKNKYREVETHHRYSESQYILKAESSCPVLQDKCFRSRAVNTGIQFLENLSNQIRKLE